MLLLGHWTSVQVALPVNIDGPTRTHEVAMVQLAESGQYQYHALSLPATSSPITGSVVSLMVTVNGKAVTLDLCISETAQVNLTDIGTCK